MARFNDRGSYEVGNVSIVSALVNIKEVKPYYRNSIWRHDQANRMKGNTFSRGRKHSDQARKRMSKSLKGRVPGFAGKRHSEATKRKMRSNWRNQFTVGEHQ